MRWLWLILLLAGFGAILALVLSPQTTQSYPSPSTFKGKLEEAEAKLREAREATVCGWCKRKIDEIIEAVDALSSIEEYASKVAMASSSTSLGRVKSIKQEVESYMGEILE